MRETFGGGEEVVWSSGGRQAGDLTTLHVQAEKGEYIFRFVGPSFCSAGLGFSSHFVCVMS